MRVTILGAGALARAFVTALPARAVDLTIAARRPAEARRLAAEVASGALPATWL
jgi:shikimate 5-dehydrogenase